MYIYIHIFELRSSLREIVILIISQEIMVCSNIKQKEKPFCVLLQNNYNQYIVRQ